MDAGLCLSWFRYELDATATQSVVRNGTTTGFKAITFANAISQYADTQFTSVDFASATARIEETSAGVVTRFYTFGLDGATNTKTKAGTGTPRSTLEFEDLKVYVIDAFGSKAWFITWSNANWLIDGVVDTVLGGGSKVGTYFAPSGCPLLGIPALADSVSGIDPAPLAPTGGGPGSGFASATTPVVPAYDSTVRGVENAVHSIEDPFADQILAPYFLSSLRFDNQAPNFPTGDVTVNGSCDGGWRFKPTSLAAYITPSIALSADTTPLPNPGDCTCEPSLGSVSGADTYSISATSFAFLDLQDATTILEVRSARAHGFPDWTKRLTRLNPDYRALIDRRTIHGAAGGKTVNCDIGDPDPDTCLMTFVNQFPVTVLADGNEYPGLHHTTDLQANYANMNCSPLWSMVLPFPLVGGADQWPVNSVDERSDEYFIPLGEQFMDWTGLPSEEATQTRNSVVSEPLMSGQFASHHEFFIGIPTSWWGISRFDKMDYTMPATFTYASANSALFAAVSDCSLGFGANITVTLDPGKTSCVVRLDLASFTADPRLLPQIADKFATEWSDGSAAVVSVDVYVENPHGDKSLLTDVSSATGVKRPDDITDSKYAGSWAQDHGAGAVVDTGVDQEPEGESATVMASAERVNAYQLIAGFGAKFLRFEITIDTPAGTMNLEYPVLTMPFGTAAVLAENGSWSSIMWPFAPGIRFSQWDWLDGAVLQTTPLVALLGVPGRPAGGKKPSVTDALAFKRVMIQGEPASAANINTDVAALYDTVETNTQTFDEADVDTIAFVFRNPADAVSDIGLYLLVNTWREAPACISVPTMNRSTVLVPNETDWGMYAWSLIRGPRSIVHRAQGVIELVDPADSTVWTTIVDLTIAGAKGWKDARHEHALDNNELDDHELTGSKVFAKLSPWHGYHALLPGVADQRQPTNYQTPLGHYQRAVAVDGDIIFRSVYKDEPEGGFDIVTEITNVQKDGFPSIMHDRLTGSLYTLYEREDPASTWTTYQVTSDDAGASWNTATSLFTGGRFPRAVASASGTLLFFAWKYNSGSSGPGRVFVRIQKPGDASPSAEQVITDGTSPIDFAEDEVFDVAPVNDGTDRWVLVAKPDGGATVTAYQSNDDGATWETLLTLGTWKFPRVAASKNGTLLYTGWKYVSGSSGPGNIFQRLQKPGDSTPAVEAAITDGTDVIDFAEDETFDVTNTFSGQDRWVLAARIDGETDVSEHHSHDDGATWELV